MSNTTIGHRLDAWRQALAEHLTDGTLSDQERDCLTTFLSVFAKERSHLVQCYDRQGFPRTRNEPRAQYSRTQDPVSPHQRAQELEQLSAPVWAARRLLRLVGTDASRQRQLLGQVARLDRTRWREVRGKTKAVQSEQLKRSRFRHRRRVYLTALEQCRVAAAST